jgi:hypothetical protein
MKNICFIGSFDKLDLLLYISKIVKNLGKKALIIDSTDLQKARYIVPTINPTKSYITTFDDIDVAIGFESYQEIERYIGFTENQKMKYDYALVNVDNNESFKKFNNEDTIKNYFVTSFELYSIRKGLETIKQIEKPIKITKLVFSREINENDNYYLDYLALGHKIIWEDEVINFPYETSDLEVMIENQKNFKIKIKGLSQPYKDNLEYLISNIMPDVNRVNVRKIMKNMEREV